MTLPKMILFDYGHTLLYDPVWDGLRGSEALMRYAVKNPRGRTAAQVSAFADELFDRVCTKQGWAIDREIHERQFNQLLYGLLQIEFSIPPQEQERVFYNAFICTQPMPHIEELLGFLASQGIRAGVVSNFSASAEQLRERIAQHLPLDRFEFTIASSEYGVRKPNPLIFDLALAKADLPPEDVWFCGDNPRCDVEGAHAAGMFPVWYENLALENPWHEPEPPACPHLHIHDWREFIEILKERT